MLMDDKRKKIEDLIYKTFNLLDLTGLNTKKYKEYFKKMTDKDFSKWLNGFLSSDDYLQLEVLPYKNEPSFDDIEKAAAFLKVPLEEYVYYKHEGSSDGTPVRSRDKVCTGYISVRRLQQILSKKNSYTTDISKRSSMFGTVSGESQIARESDAETNSLITLGADITLKELLSERADNTNRKTLMYNTIARDGFVRQKDLDVVEDLADKTTLNTFEVYLVGSGLETDLLGEDKLLYATKLGINYKQ
jgi:hypothetical protein